MKMRGKSNYFISIRIAIKIKFYSLREDHINKRQIQKVRMFILFRISYLRLSARGATLSLARQKWKRADRAIRAKRKKSER